MNNDEALDWWKNTTNSYSYHLRGGLHAIHTTTGPATRIFPTSVLRPIAVLQVQPQLLTCADTPEAHYRAAMTAHSTTHYPHRGGKIWKPSAIIAVLATLITLGLALDPSVASGVLLAGTVAVVAFSVTITVASWDLRQARNDFYNMIAWATQHAGVEAAAAYAARPLDTHKTIFHQVLSGEPATPRGKQKAILNTISRVQDTTSVREGQRR